MLGCPFTVDDQVRAYFMLTDTMKRDPSTGNLLSSSSRPHVTTRGWVNGKVVKLDKGQVQVTLDCKELGLNKPYQRWFHGMSDEIKRICELDGCMGLLWGMACFILSCFQSLCESLLYDVIYFTHPS